MISQILPAIAVAIFNDKGQILLQKRRDVGKWCVISGHVEFGETLEAAALREILEETTVKASVKRLIGIYSSPQSQTYHYPGRKVQYITSYFEAVLHSDIPPNYSNNETQQLKFFSPGATPADLAQIHPCWLKDALEKSSHVFVR